MSIHPTAIVDHRAEIDPTVDIGPYAVIDGHVRIVAGCRVMGHAYITGWTEIGEGCVIHPAAIVGHEPGDVKYTGERTYCRIGKNCIIREQVTIHRGTAPESATIIGDNCFLLAASHVGHNCVVGNNVTLVHASMLGGHVTVGDRATIGGNSGIHQFCRIGELAMIAGQSRALMDILPFALSDLQGKIAGLNRIGLRRAGYSRDDVAALREAYRQLFGSGASFRSAANALIESAPTSPAVRKLVEFLKVESKRGFAGRSRKSKQTAESTDSDE